MQLVVCFIFFRMSGSKQQEQKPNITGKARKKSVSNATTLTLIVFDWLMMYGGDISSSPEHQRWRLNEKERESQIFFFPGRNSQCVWHSACVKQTEVCIRHKSNMPQKRCKECLNPSILPWLKLDVWRCVWGNPQYHTEPERLEEC